MRFAVVMYGGTSLAIFSSSLYMGLTAGVAVAAPFVDRFTAVPVFLIAAIAFPALCAVIARGLIRKRRAELKTPTPI